MELATYQSYEQYKAELDGELQKTAEGFVRIGYLLKVARDTNVLAESGYKTVAEFAEAEYNLDKTQVSRFISINDRFSEGGYSDRLISEYQGFGYAKLTIMLQIPEAIAEELSPSYSKAEIQAVKEEVDEERKVSDLEVLMEPQKPDLGEMDTVGKILFVLLKEDWKLYERIWEKYKKTMDEYAVQEILAPSGEKTYSVRIPGKGRIMMFLDDTKDEIQLVSVRTEEKESTTWKKMADAIRSMVFIETETARKSWEACYGEQWPGEEKKAEVAPVQQPKKQEPKKESKVQKAKKPEKPKKPSMEPEEAAVVEEEQLPGQMTVEDFPELIPETEVREENDGEDDESGMPDRTGDEADHGEPAGVEEVAGDEAAGDAEVSGAAESRGREGNYDEDLITKAWWAWMDLRTAMPASRQGLQGMASLKALYDNAIALAAALEECMGEKQ